MSQPVPPDPPSDRRQRADERVLQYRRQVALGIVPTNPPTGRWWTITVVAIIVAVTALVVLTGWYLWALLDAYSARAPSP